MTLTKTKEEFNKEYASYPAVGGNLDEKPFYESRYAPIFYEIPIGSKVLDCGVNDGIFAEMLQNKRQCEVTGVDLSDVALAEAEKRGIKAIKADVENLPFEDESFDVVLAMELLSHLFDPIKALKEMRRVLKKNGVLLGSCPHRNLENYAWDDKRLHRRYYDQVSLKEDLETSFYDNYVKILNGSQFSMSLANGFLADQEVEMLFKCGRKGTEGWDSALNDKSILRCWFGFTQTPGTVYYRMSGFADNMQKMGAQVHYNPYDETDFNSPGEWCQKIRYQPQQNRFTNPHIVRELESLLKAADMSVFQIVPHRDNLLLLTTARKGVIKKPMWCEIDDWLFDIPSYNLAAYPYQPNSEMEAVAFDQIKLSDGIICSTEWLKEHLQELFPEKPIYVVKNSIDFEIWGNLDFKRPDHEANPDLIRVTFSGCGNHSGDLELVKEPIRVLLEEFPNLEFISIPFSSLDEITNPRFKRVTKWVSMSTYPQYYASWETDIAIGPLRDCNLNRAKSNLRWLESSAVKAPMIASDIYPFHNSIEHGKTGILVRNSEQGWYNNLKTLISLKGLREEIGQKAYEKVRKDYSMEKESKKYLSILKSIKNEFIKHVSIYDGK